MARPQTDWQLRFKWAAHAGIQHPEYTYDGVQSRGHALEVAWIRWPRVEQDVTLLEICVHRLPDGEWELLLPVETASCPVPAADLPPGE